MSVYPEALRILFNTFTLGFVFGLGIYGGKCFCRVVGPYARSLLWTLRKLSRTARRLLKVHFQKH